MTKGILLALVASNKMFMICLVLIVLFEVKGIISADKDSEWTGRLFPDSNPSVMSDNQQSYANFDHHGRIQMGIKNEHCDWGEDPFGFDGDLGPENYECFKRERFLYRPNRDVHPILHKDHIPQNFVPWHHCMNESITYTTSFPTYGDHRPLWPKYGEYTYLPKQRWLHSLEHGSIVMLYHPCADRNEVELVKTLLKGCLYQYVTSAWKELDWKRPIALVAWGVRLHISKVHVPTVIDFIRTHSYKAPEKVTDDGQYDKNLVAPASTDLKGQENNVCAKN